MRMVPTSHSARVLVVDDDPRDRQTLAEIITDLGYNCETAEDGEAALKKQDAAPFDVIISDLMMPRMDGFELLRTLFERGDLTPAIVLTGAGKFVELQATSEKMPFDDAQLSRLLELGRLGIRELVEIQKQALGT